MQYVYTYIHTRRPASKTSKALCVSCPHVGSSRTCKHVYKMHTPTFTPARQQGRNSEGILPVCQLLTELSSRNNKRKYLCMCVYSYMCIHTHMQTNIYTHLHSHLQASREGLGRPFMYGAPMLAPLLYVFMHLQYKHLHLHPQASKEGLVRPFSCLTTMLAPHTVYYIYI